jgi:lipopolysaccharide/colanic/teichoic acid biosynthesis glycosyltransferase
MIFIMIFIKVVSFEGSPFFIQTREGLGGKKIKVVKFRTMHVDSQKRLETFLVDNPESAKEWYQFYKLDPKVDPRLIRFGDFLRKTSLDELPNLWNVITGDLSLVGPRPFPYYHLETYDSEFRKFRASVWPGLTGLWQIERGDSETQKRLDIEYITNWSFKLDLKILARTLFVLLLSRKTHY